MATENDSEVIELVRDLNTLLALGTYQGMTDAEIDSIIEYKVSVGINSYTVLAQLQASTDAAAQVAARAKSASDSALSMLESILAGTVQLQSVEG